MTFDEWLQHKRDAGQKPFGTAYELFAKCAWNAAIAAAAQETMDNWIDVKERKPHSSREVLVYVYPGNELPYTSIASWNGTAWRCVIGAIERSEHITHWMPLPQPPKAV